MITIIHGDNILASRKELEKIKNEFKGEIIQLDGATLSETDFIQATQSQAMFASSRLVIIDGLPKFNINSATCDVVVLENKKGFPASLSKFLNNMTVANFRAALKDNDVQFIFIMMARQRKKDRKKLLELDYQNKQGLLPCDFPTAIELFLLNLYD